MSATRPLSHESVEDNLRFLIREVEAQVTRTRSYLARPHEATRTTLLQRDNYIDNLRTFIQRACFSHAVTVERVEYLKAVDVIAVNMERIADFCADIIDQLQYITDAEVLAAQPFDAFFDEVLRGLAQVEPAVLELDVHLALSVCRAEPRLDNLFGEQFAHDLVQIRGGGSLETHVTLLFIWHYFERMGDSLLNIGEAIISAALGEKIKIGQLWALEDSLEGVKQALDDVVLESVGESRSGCRIVRVADRDPDAATTSVIFKEGNLEKLREEKAGIDLWDRHVPGTAPKVFSFKEEEPNSALLMEYLPGQTFEEFLLRPSADGLARAFALVTRDLEAIWAQTRSPTPVPSQFCRQLRKRLPDIYTVHPSFRGARKDVGRMAILPMQELLERCEALEDTIAAPFGVLTHGDFNIDNIICDTDNDRVRLIDLHRSRIGDYVQDASVFLVSNFRLQIFETPVRQRINEVARAFYHFTHDFAQRMGDETFVARMAFGLARSFATSTRFVLDEGFANTLLLRARYLLDRLVLCTPEQLVTFKIPEDILTD